MYNTIVTDKTNKHFIALVEALDGHLGNNYGDLQHTYQQFNGLDEVKEVVLIYDGDNPIACGTYKALDTYNAELKRIFVKDSYRGQGLGQRLVEKLESIIVSSGFTTVWLETGAKQIGAIHLYKKLGYVVTGNYGQYQGMANSVCMKKQMVVGFPPDVIGLPEADIPLEGITAYLSQGSEHQIIFMQFDEDVELPKHSHAGQYGVVLEGKIRLNIDGFEATYTKGDRYYIPEGIPHSGKIYAGYADITFFAQKDRYTPK